MAWANDNKTVFYTSKNKVTLLGEKIYRHKAGTDSKLDKLVYEEEDETFYNGVYRSKSGKYIIIYNCSTLVSDYHILSADNPDGQFINLRLEVKNMSIVFNTIRTIFILFLI